ncbi:MAG: trehalose-6-phosphate synthase [Chloroflexi bacterium]|nr:trehalose-6-phosphate synthase [Chloroflexota bacterium]
MSVQRLIIMSNRGPYHIHVTKQGIKREKTVGGLVTSILPMVERWGGVWISWGEPEGRYPGSAKPLNFDLHYIGLTPEELQGYYLGLANNALWPLCHYFLGRVHYDNSQWQMYQQVNRKFAKVALEEAQAGDLIWVHDYHLACVPQYLREAQTSNRIVFFWHIPFPAAELFRTLPWRRPFLESLLACDLIGFHVPEFAENFIETAIEVLDAQFKGSSLEYGGRTTQIIARPIGIDYVGVAKQAQSSITEKRVRGLRKTLNGQKIILGVERMDYTKGIVERLQAMEYLLEHHPELRRSITLVQLVTPSRADVEAYRQRKREIDEMVGRINGRFSDGIWVPIRYQYRSFSPAELVAYYRAADIALVTPLRDGLNLVAKEYVASRTQTDGVLILSEFAGVARQLLEALMVNPYSSEDMAGIIVQALQMPKDEQRKRMQAMQDRIKREDINWWAEEFLNQKVCLEDRKDL